MARDAKFLTAIRHPDYLEDEMYWYEWRDTYNGGPNYVRRNLKKFSNRESNADFNTRKFYTPIPAHAKAAVNDIRNSIFQRLRDVTRRGGSENYMRAAAGEIGGVDNKGASMQSFLGIEVLTELLVMGRAGVYVDMPALAGLRTMADEGNARPYCYKYAVEDILSWAVAKPEEPGNFTAVLLRDRGVDYNQGFANGAYLPSGGYNRYRFIWIDPFDRTVKMRMFDENDNLINLRGGIIMDRETFNGNVETDAGVIHLELERIPFTMLSIGGSIIKDVSKHQVALLNLVSADVSYAIKANFPIYIEQRDVRAVGNHLKIGTVDDDGTSNTSDNSGVGTEERMGISHGRFYDLKADPPGFINPSSEPLEASMKLREALEDEIRKLVNLEVQNKTGQRAISAEAMKLSDQGLEAGLSFIGLVLESAERDIASHWAAYENRDPEQRKIATIKYPDRYSLKNDEDRIKEASELAKLMFTVPGKEVKKEIAKAIVASLLAGKVNNATLDRIYKQIDDAGYATSDPETIRSAVESGLCGEKTASIAMGFDDNEYLQARKDHIARAEAVAKAQAAAKPATNMAARGVPDLDEDPDSGEDERKEANDTTLSDDKNKPVRGKGKNLDKGDE